MKTKISLGRLLISLSFMICLIYACQPDDESVFLEAEEEKIRDISVDEVREKYEEIMSNTSLKRADEDYIVNILWDNGIYKELSMGDALAFPLRSDTGKKDEEVFFSVGDDSIKYIHDYHSFALAYKDSLGLHLDYYRVIPTERNDRFTGYLLVYEWNASLKQILVYEDGEFVETSEPIETASSAEGKLNRLGCMAIYDMNCVTVTVGDATYQVSYTHCQYGTTTWICSGSSILKGPDPNQFFDGVKGGGSNVSSCHHPYLDGMVVDCNQINCPPGYEPDGKGGCKPVEKPCFGSPCCDENGSLIAECENDRPCPDNPLKNMEITSPGASGKNGGRHGWTRQKWDEVEKKYVPKYHNGLDLTSNPGTYVFSPFSGKVVDVRNSFDPNGYLRNSYGNYVIVESTTSSGETFRFQYAHLDYVNVEVGQTIGPGMMLGRSGTTGNMGNATPHVHIKATKKNGSSWQSANPENYLKVKYNSDGEVETDPCEN